MKIITKFEAKLSSALDPYITRWLDHYHSDGEPHDCYYFRCQGCQRLNTWKDIRLGGCDCGTNRLTPAAITKTTERWRMLLFPWTIGTRSKSKLPG